MAVIMFSLQADQSSIFDRLAMSLLGTILIIYDCFCTSVTVTDNCNYIQVPAYPQFHSLEQCIDSSSPPLKIRWLTMIFDTLRCYIFVHNFKLQGISVLLQYVVIATFTHIATFYSTHFHYSSSCHNNGKNQRNIKSMLYIILFCPPLCFHPLSLASFRRCSSWPETVCTRAGVTYYFIIFY